MRIFGTCLKIGHALQQRFLQKRVDDNNNYHLRVAWKNGLKVVWGVRLVQGFEQ